MGVPPSFEFHSGGTMRKEETEFERTIAITRRRFVQDMEVGAALAACGWKDRPAFGENAPSDSEILTGAHFDLTVDWLPVNFTGRPSRATAVNGSVPGPILRWREGDTVTIAVTNRLKHATSIHWHGVGIPGGVGGVPGLGFGGIGAGDS